MHVSENSKRKSTFSTKILTIHEIPFDTMQSKHIIPQEIPGGYCYKLLYLQSGTEDILHQKDMIILRKMHGREWPFLYVRFQCWPKSLLFFIEIFVCSS